MARTPFEFQSHQNTLPGSGRRTPARNVPWSERSSLWSERSRRRNARSRRTVGTRPGPTYTVTVSPTLGATTVCPFISAMNFSGVGSSRPGKVP